MLTRIKICASEESYTVTDSCSDIIICIPIISSFVCFFAWLVLAPLYRLASRSLNAASGMEAPAVVKYDTNVKWRR